MGRPQIEPLVAGRITKRFSCLCPSFNLNMISYTRPGVGTKTFSKTIYFIWSPRRNMQTLKSRLYRACKGSSFFPFFLLRFCTCTEPTISSLLQIYLEYYRQVFVPSLFIFCFISIRIYREKQSCLIRTEFGT